MARPSKQVRWDVLNGGWTADFAWMLGLIFGDGNIFKKEGENYTVS